jgi:prolipoprotein diacylglyceryltransferase
MESAGLAVLTVILLAALRSSSFRRPGQLAGLYLLGAGLLRTGLEFLRGDYRGDPVIWGLPPTTLAAMLAAILGAAILIRKRP